MHMFVKLFTNARRRMHTLPCPKLSPMAQKRSDPLTGTCVRDRKGGCGANSVDGACGSRQRPPGPIVSEDTQTTKEAGEVKARIVFRLL